MVQSESHESTPEARLFLTTHWSVVLSARDKHSPNSTQALETLCHTYWYPLYAFVRRSGYAPCDAQDLTQGFFEQLLARNYLRLVTPEKGRFRTFLKVALKRFLIHEWDRKRAQKRGGGVSCLSLDTTLAEERFQSERTDTLAPDEIYDQRWALSLLQETVRRLESEFAAAGKANEWAALKPYLTADRGTVPYEEIARLLQTTEAAARVATHRLRKQFRELFRQLVGETVANPEDIDDELRHIVAALGRI
jgi:RNA polymerase sigma-70 factor (ECF subfamily)